MTKEATESEPPIVFDHCPRGDGMWFDKGELQQVIQHGTGLTNEGQVSGFLHDMFSENDGQIQNGDE